MDRKSVAVQYGIGYDMNTDQERRVAFMMMTSIELKVSIEAKTYVMDKTTEEIRNALLLYPSIANDTISHGRAAELLGISKMELIELYGSLGIPYMDMTDEEFEEEIQTIRRIVEKLS